MVEVRNTIGVMGFALMPTIILAATLMSAPAYADTGLVIRQHGQLVPLTTGKDGRQRVSLDRSPFELLFPRAAFENSTHQVGEPYVQVLVSEDSAVFDFIQNSPFQAWVAPASSYATPPEGKHYLMLTDVGADPNLVAHNYMYDYRMDLLEPELMGFSVDHVVERDMTDRLRAGPSALFAVILIPQDEPTYGELQPGDTRTRALIDDLVLSFRN